jgi:NarL family two-component system response regulator LiaR
MKHSIRVLIADDHAIVRRGLCALLATEPDIEVVGQVQDGREAVDAARRLRPDLILMDLSMPRMDGLTATRSIRSLQPDVRVLALATFSDESRLCPAIRAGVHGYLLKDSRPEDLVHAIQQVCGDETALHPSLARKLLVEFVHPAALNPASELLTAGEIEVLRLVARGLSDREISSRLRIGRVTVRSVVSSILAKLNLGNQPLAESPA